VSDAVAIPGTAPASGRVRAFYAPIQRESGTQTTFEPATQGHFPLDTPPAGWIDLGWVHEFKRTSQTKVEALQSGAPLLLRGQTRKQAGAEVSLRFDTWGKLQMGISGGAQAMNLLLPSSVAVALGSGSTARSLIVADASGFAAGDLVAVDADYAGETGYVGAGVRAAYVKSADAVTNDGQYLRRVTYNVGHVVGVSANTLTLAAPLLAGVPNPTMKVAKIVGFVDREGGGFFHEWSALFVVDGVQGDRVLYHYPRLQMAEGAAEEAAPLTSAMTMWRLAARFRALPVVDANDGEQALCFRSYLPAAMRLA
jgi:hypothetical protein